MSSVGYGFLWNLPSYGSVSITPENITWFSEASQNVDFWVTTIPATTKGMDNCLLIFVQGAQLNNRPMLVIGHWPQLVSGWQFTKELNSLGSIVPLI